MHFFSRTGGLSSRAKKGDASAGANSRARAG